MKRHCMMMMRVISSQHYGIEYLKMMLLTCKLVCVCFIAQCTTAYYSSICVFMYELHATAEYAANAFVRLNHSQRSVLCTSISD
jgi:hypothetical protein